MIRLLVSFMILISCLVNENVKSTPWSQFTLIFLFSTGLIFCKLRFAEFLDGELFEILRILNVAKSLLIHFIILLSLWYFWEYSKLSKTKLGFCLEFYKTFSSFDKLLIKWNVTEYFNGNKIFWIISQSIRQQFFFDYATN